MNMVLTMNCLYLSFALIEMFRFSFGWMNGRGMKFIILYVAAYAFSLIYWLMFIDDSVLLCYGIQSQKKKMD